MIRRLLLCAALLAGLPAAQAALKPGAPAPDFTAEAAVGGQPFRFSLAAELKKGPVVLYFYPKAYTGGCTIEAHQFAEASDRFKALGATVIGISTDDIETLKKFSVEACRSKFAVAADAGGKVMKDYDAALRLLPGTADRISYLITPEGRIGAVFSSLSPDGHVDAMLTAAQQWKASAK
ncbi:peroxiredoxin [Paucibacter sp. M5-1]|uniref:peroxiredoxin n=1 Tax=Paucibacter sp. M5-1 TaxID=3015998 RepID=UPI0022B8EF84|nr:peroxiredoxin [Paucibacter sp. M5-1]MCZ7882369.1 peroxiredoxin [Paucibacter sp. M5-1]